jgi:putative ATP-dependent endonuclease of OLD family
VPLDNQVVLTASGTPITQSVRPSRIPGIAPEDVADLNRYLDATRSTLLYARKVLLVEGPAEQFLVPPLVQRLMGVNLDDLGIAVVPIYGTHFGVYTKLFGPNGIRKKCAVLADGDLVPSDADPNVELEDGGDDEFPDAIELPNQLDVVENEFVRIFQSATTFEREITLIGNLQMMQRAAAEIGAPGIANRLDEAIAANDNLEEVDIDDLKSKVLNTAKRFGKARFAQLASKHVEGARVLPAYIINAINWLRQ